MNADKSKVELEGEDGSMRGVRMNGKKVEHRFGVTKFRVR